MRDPTRHVSPPFPAIVVLLGSWMLLPGVQALPDKCIKRVWPDVVHPCGTFTSYHGGCEARIGRFSSKYRGSCTRYCSSFGFRCSSGLIPATGTLGCNSSGGTYLSCTERRLDVEHAVCRCSDPMDTFLWSGAARLCGSGRVLVRNLSTCEEFCSAQGLSCAEAAKASEENCTGGPSVSCESPLAGASAVCLCSGVYDRTGAPLWPDTLEVCGIGVALVSGKVLRRTNGTCDGFCRSLRGRVPGFDRWFVCYGVWPARGRGCSAYTSSSSDHTPCNEDTRGQDAVCACSFPDRRL